MSWEPKFSIQGNERTCGLHCVAMITHLPYEFIKKEYPYLKGTSEYKVRMMLGMLGYETDFEWKKFVKGMKLPDLCILHVANHWCIHFKGMIYDSNIGIFDIREDRRRIKHFIKVEIPN